MSDIKDRETHSKLKDKLIVIKEQRNMHEDKQTKETYRKTQT